jgi:hypothetical protein
MFESIQTKSPPNNLHSILDFKFSNHVMHCLTSQCSLYCACIYI